MRPCYKLAGVIGTAVLAYLAWRWVLSPLITLPGGLGTAGEKPDEFIARCWPLRLIRGSGIRDQSGFASWCVMEVMARLRIVLLFGAAVVSVLLWRAFREPQKSKV